MYRASLSPRVPPYSSCTATPTLLQSHTHSPSMPCPLSTTATPTFSQCKPFSNQRFSLICIFLTLRLLHKWSYSGCTTIGISMWLPGNPFRLSRYVSIVYLFWWVAGSMVWPYHSLFSVWLLWIRHWCTDFCANACLLFWDMCPGANAGAYITCIFVISINFKIVIWYTTQISSSFLSLAQWHQYVDKVWLSVFKIIFIFQNWLCKQKTPGAHPTLGWTNMGWRGREDRKELCAHCREVWSWRLTRDRWERGLRSTSLSMVGRRVCRNWSLCSCRLSPRTCRPGAGPSWQSFIFWIGPPQRTAVVRDATGDHVSVYGPCYSPRLLQHLRSMQI